MTSPWSQDYIDKIAGPTKTACEVILQRTSSVTPQVYCCGSNTISASKGPSCRIAVTPEVGDTDTVFEFDGSNSFSPDNDIDTYVWSFGDGASASGITAYHQYAEEGNFEVTLTVKDLLGVEAECAKIVVVKNPSLPIMPNTAGNKVFVGGTGRAWYTAAFGIDDATTPPWAEKSTGLPSGARVNEIRVDPQTPTTAYAACGSPTHAVNGGLRKCINRDAGVWADITPSKPDQWRDPEWTGTEATRSSATLISLSADEWNKANWKFIRPSFVHSGNLVAICEIKKTGVAAYGTFVCFYSGYGGTWEIEQLWLNDIKPWWCKPLQMDVCLSRCRYVYLTLEGQAPASNYYKIQCNIDKGKPGAWFTSQINIGGTLYKPSGAVAAYHMWKRGRWHDGIEDEEHENDPLDSPLAQFAITTSPWIVESTLAAGGEAIASYAPNKDGGWALRGDQTYAKLAQGFQVVANSHIGKIQLYLTRQNFCTGTIWIEIQLDDGGVPSGTTISHGVSTKVDISELGAPGVVDPGYEWVDFTFEVAPELEAGTQYHLILLGSYSYDANKFIGWAYNTAAGYADGTPSTFDATASPNVWVTRANDNVFRMYDFAVTWAAAPYNFFKYPDEAISSMWGLSPCSSPTYPAKLWYSWTQLISGDQVNQYRYMLFSGPHGLVNHTEWSGHIYNVTPITFPSLCCTEKTTPISFPGHYGGIVTDLLFAKTGLKYINNLKADYDAHGIPYVCPYSPNPYGTPAYNDLPEPAATACFKAWELNHMMWGVLQRRSAAEAAMGKSISWAESSVNSWIAYYEGLFGRDDVSHITAKLFVTKVGYNWIATDSYSRETFLGANPGLNTYNACTAITNMPHRLRIILAFNGAIRLGLRVSPLHEDRLGWVPSIQGEDSYYTRHYHYYAFWYTDIYGEPVYYEISTDPIYFLQVARVNLTVCRTGAQMKSLYPGVCPTLSDTAHGFLFDGEDALADTFYNKTGVLPETIYGIGVNHFEV